ncbi:vanadium-dependent haloperoxidase [Streptomyces sp. NPDC006997]|uniref:vanadium-dependent haloperoxidase n=1 Tax=Streptomyces sp. NPDC006997 TaxID=3155356 RepID=UPI0033E9A539
MQTTAPRSVRKGRFRARLPLALVAALATAGTLLVAAPAPARAALPPQTIQDPVHYWNDVLIKLIKRVGGGPVPFTRAAAMMNAAIYDADSSYQLTWKGGISSAPYIDADPYPGWIEGPDEEERVIGRTAYNILLHLYGSETAFLDQRFRERFGTEPTDFDILDTTVVNKMVTQMEDARRLDGSENREAYTGTLEPGAWRPTNYADMNDPACQTQSDAVDPNWGLVKPFALTSGAQFRPPTPGVYGTYQQLLASDAYEAQVEAVRRVGAEQETTETPEVNRTVDQEAAAWFWANDNDGTFKPPGQLLQATRDIATQRGLNTYQNARLFALVSIALADAGIAVRDVKYQTEIDLWRPVSAIRESGIDPEWKPLLKNADGVNVNPCFPAWASGHATFGAAWAGIMRRYFNADGIAFDMVTDDPRSPVHTRHFTSFSAAAREDAYSRVWLGVHFPWDAEDGLTLGEKVAGYVFDNRLVDLS